MSETLRHMSVFNKSHYMSSLKSVIQFIGINYLKSKSKLAIANCYYMRRLRTIVSYLY